MTTTASETTDGVALAPPFFSLTPSLGSSRKNNTYTVITGVLVSPLSVAF